MNLLLFLHARLAIALILLAVILGIWGSLSLATKQAVSPGFRSSYLLMIGVTALQGLVGVVASAEGSRPHELLHVVYGIFAFLFLPGVYFFANRGSRNREAMLLAIACWIVAIVYGRGIVTGG